MTFLLLLAKVLIPVVEHRYFSFLGGGGEMFPTTFNFLLFLLPIYTLDFIAARYLDVEV